MLKIDLYVYKIILHFRICLYGIVGCIYAPHILKFCRKYHYKLAYLPYKAIETLFYHMDTFLVVLKYNCRTDLHGKRVDSCDGHNPEAYHKPEQGNRINLMKNQLKYKFTLSHCHTGVAQSRNFC